MSSSKDLANINKRSSDLEEQNPILVPIDFTAASRIALGKAMEMANVLNRPLLVMYAIHDKAYCDEAKKRSKKAQKKCKERGKHIQTMAEQATEIMDEFIQGMREIDQNSLAYKNMKTLLVPGIPATRIVEIAERENASMIVMCTHYHSFVKKILSSSISKDVIDNVTADVLLVHENKQKKSKKG